MEYQSSYEVREYLNGFNKILWEMSSKMLGFNTTSNITINFIECMIPYNEAEIDMYENLLTYTNHKKLYQIANNAIKIESQNIAEMKDIVRTSPTCANYPNHVTNYENKYLEITNNMINKMKNSPRTQNINYNFTKEMILHYEGGIQICENLLKYPIDPRLKNATIKLIKEQNKKIERLKNIQEEIYK